MPPKRTTPGTSTPSNNGGGKSQTQQLTKTLKTGAASFSSFVLQFVVVVIFSSFTISFFIPGNNVETREGKDSLKTQIFQLLKKLFINKPFDRNIVLWATTPRLNLVNLVNRKPGKRYKSTNRVLIPCYVI
jgi:hypothetical protein